MTENCCEMFTNFGSEVTQAEKLEELAELVRQCPANKVGDRLFVTVSWSFYKWMRKIPAFRKAWNKTRRQRAGKQWKHPKKRKLRK